MAGGSKQEENVKRAMWKGAIVRVGWGGRWGLLVLLWMFLLPGLGATLAQVAPFGYVTNYDE